jgi:F-type H+-transporting ATPase subunit delta
VAAVWKKSGVELLRRLLTLLAERNRMELLPEIHRRFTELWNAHRGVVTAEAVAAQPLPAAEARRLADALQRATRREVDLRSSVDPDVLGGVLVRMEGRVYDGTVRARLRALRARLVGEPAGS